MNFDSNASEKYMTRRSFDATPIRPKIGKYIYCVNKMIVDKACGDLSLECI